MDPGRTSYNLLAHFDSPFEGQAAPHNKHVRGVGWVLKWAAAFAVLFVAGCVLIEFGYCTAAEHALARAARAGALEATLPRATQQSVVETIGRRLSGYSIPSDRLQIVVLQNGVPIRGVFRTAGGDRLSVTVSAPNDCVLPTWLRAVTFWPSDWQLHARAEQRMPGRQLQMAARD